MYHCVCHSCEEDEIIDGLERAQEYFNEHADRRCEVELLNLGTVNHPTVELSHSDSTTEGAQEAGK